MTSDAPTEGFVWIWTPGALAPVVAGRLDVAGPLLTFTYGQSYLGHDAAIPVYLPELPLGRGPREPPPGLTIPGCIDDGGPDAWGQRVIMRRVLGAGAAAADPADLSALTYLLTSGSDRIGALDFQASSDDYVPRGDGAAHLDELLEAAQRVESGVPFSPAIDQALVHGSSVGGARPKALLESDDGRWIAKFSSTTDTYPVVKGEFVAMELARRAGLDVAAVTLTSALGKDVLMVERFDRPDKGGRRAVVSALTMLGLGELFARYASYADLAQIIRERFTEPRAALRELFTRIVFNVLVGNTDDHARNHAAFWDGEALTLTPAYDLCPQPRAGGETAQAMAIGPSGFRMSQVAGCVEAASTYLLSKREAQEIAGELVRVIETEWRDVCDLASLTEVDRAYFWRRQFLNPYAFEGAGR